MEKVACVPDELTKEPRMWSGRGREEGRRGGCGRVCGCLSCALVRFFDRSYADTQLFYIVLRAGGQYLGKTDLVLRAGGRRYMIFGPPDKIHVGLSSVTPTVPVLEACNASITPLDWKCRVLYSLGVIRMIHAHVTSYP